MSFFELQQKQICMKKHRYCSFELFLQLLIIINHEFGSTLRKMFFHVTNTCAHEIVTDKVSSSLFSPAFLQVSAVFCRFSMFLPVSERLAPSLKFKETKNSMNKFELLDTKRGASKRLFLLSSCQEN